MELPRCKSCNAEIKWIKMANGKAHPVDPLPIAFNVTVPDGEHSHVFVTDDGKVTSGYPDTNGEKTGYISHFATCPFAHLYRKGKRP